MAFTNPSLAATALAVAFVLAVPLRAQTGAADWGPGPSQIDSVPLVARFGLLERADGVFIAPAGPAALALESGGFALFGQDGAGGGARVRIRFSDEARPEADATSAAGPRVRVFGADAATSDREPLRCVRRVRYRDVAPGIDVVVRALASGLAYDVEAAPGADVEALTFTLEGASDLRIRDDGSLAIETAAGVFVQRAPRTFTRDASPRALASRFVKVAANAYRFAVEARSDATAVTIDPGLEFATRYGGGDWDDIAALVVAPSGAVLVCGKTWSTNLPLGGVPFDASVGFPYCDAFVAALAADGKSLAWATYFGGSANDAATALAQDALGRVLVAGKTDSTDFPVTAGAFDTAYGGNGDGFIARLDGGGAALGFSAYVGGSQSDEVRGVAISAQGTTLIAGVTSSVDFPVTPAAFDTTFQGNPASPDAFCAGVDAGASALVFSTFLGGDSVDEARAVAALGADAIVVGRTDSLDWPVTAGALDTTFGAGLNDGFAARIDGTNGQLVFSTFVGGVDPDVMEAVTTNGVDTIVVAGHTRSIDAPAANGYDAFYNGGDDAYVLLLTAQGALIAGSFLGTSGDERALGVALDALGQAVIVGRADAAGFPATTLAFDQTYNGASDAFISKFKPVLETLAESTYFGGAGFDEAHACGVTATGGVIFAGRTTSADLPATAGVFQSLPQGSSDGFLGLVRAKMCPQAPAVSTYGVGKAGTKGIPVLGSLNLPVVPSSDFQITIGSGLPGALPLLFLGIQPAAIPFDGGQVLVNPMFNMGLFPLDALGRLYLPMPLAETQSLCGVTFLMQALWYDPGASGYYHTAQTNAASVTFGS